MLLVYAFCFFFHRTVCLSGKAAAAKILGQAFEPLPKETMLGALSDYVSNYEGEDFQPMGANFGVLPPIEPHIRDKRERYMALSQRSLEFFKNNIYHQPKGS